MEGRGTLNYATNLWQQIRGLLSIQEGGKKGARNYLACHIPQVEEVTVVGFNFNDMP